MNEELQFILDSAKESMQNAILHLENELLNIRAGKANQSCLKVSWLTITVHQHH